MKQTWTRFRRACESSNGRPVFNVMKPIIESPFMASVREQERIARRVFARQVALVLFSFFAGLVLGAALELGVK